MEEITGYKLSDGRIIENKEEAIKLQKELDFKKEIYDFIFKTSDCCNTDAQIIYNFVLDNEVELREILNKYN